MNRYYGVIKDVDTAREFITNLYNAGAVNDVNPIKLLSYYGDSTLPELDGAFDWLRNAGFVNTSLSINAQAIVLNAASKGSFGVTNPYTETAVLSDNLVIIAQAPSEDEDPPIEELCANIIIRHTVAQDDGSSLTSTTYLRWINDNNGATGLAYEISVPSDGSGDILVKIASCAPDISVDSKAFVGLSINNYEAYDSSIIPKYSHTTLNFGASGNYGGFLIHEMHDGDDVFGISVFNSDGSPLFTWLPDGESLLETNNGKMVNVNAPMGRNMGDILDEDGQPIIKMAALAPIFCPASTNYSKYAKWMQQSPHDYSYFDGSGHIMVGPKKNIFFADHGICLWDKVSGSTDMRLIPGVKPSNEAISVRPDIPDEMPYSQHMFAYFDSLAGLSSRGWMNYRDENNDMIFSGKPIINADGSCRFISRASNPVYGRFTGPMYGWDADNDKYGWMIFAVLKVNRSTTSPSGVSYIHPIIGASHPSNTWFDTSMSSPWWFTGLQSIFLPDNNLNGNLTWHATPDSNTTSQSAYQSVFSSSNVQNDYVAVCFYFMEGNGTYCTIWQNGAQITDCQLTGGRPFSNNWQGVNAHKAGVDNANWAVGAYISPTGAPPERNIWSRFAADQRAVIVYDGTSGAPTDGGEVYIDVKFLAAGVTGYNTDNGRLGYTVYGTQRSTIAPALRYLCERFNV